MSSSVMWTALFGAIAALPACGPPAAKSLGEGWAAPMREVGLVAVDPPQEDIRVGDVFAYIEDPEGRGGASDDSVLMGTTGRWTTLPALPDLDEEYRRRPEWPMTGTQEAAAPAIRLREVSLPGMAVNYSGRENVAPLIPVEAVNLVKETAWEDYKAVTVSAGTSESYALALDSVLSLLLDEVADEEGSRFVLKEPYRRFLPLFGRPDRTSAWLRVVSEVIYVRSLDVTVQAAPPPDEVEDIPPPDLTAVKPPLPPKKPTIEGDPAVIPFRRAGEINRLLRVSNLDRTPGSMVQVVSVTDRSVSLRRTWPRGLAIAVRGLTLEVDRTTGAVVRMGTMGTTLPKLPSVPPPPSENPPENDR